MNQSDRREAFERLLRSAIQPGRPTKESVCPDAEMLAAFAEGSLSADEVRAVTTHAADCARCQQVLAALGRFAEVPASRRLGGLPGSPFRWLVPIASLAAASLALYVAIRPTPVQIDQAGKPSSTAMDRKLPSTPAPHAQAERDIGRLEQETATPAPTVEQPAFEARPPEGAQRARPDRRSAAASAPETPSDELAAPRAEEKQALESSRSRRTPSRETAGSDMAAPRENLPSDAKVTGGVSPRQGELEKTEGHRQAQPAPVAAPALADRASKVGAVAGAMAATLEVKSPDGASIWRIGPGTALARSTDDGRTWVDGPWLPGFAMAAAAPSSTVCWIVGRNGLVFVTSDGTHWRHTASPSSADLVTVTATDDKRATVLTADGDRFVTDDGGTTWSAAAR